MPTKMLSHSMKLFPLLIICLSCASNPIFTTEVNAEQCSPYISLKFEAGKRFVDETNSKCLCRLYKFSNGYIGPIGTSYKVDLMKCHQLIGITAERYEEVNNFLQSLKSD